MKSKALYTIKSVFEHLKSIFVIILDKYQSFKINNKFGRLITSKKITIIFFALFSLSLITINKIVLPKTTKTLTQNNFVSMCYQGKVNSVQFSAYNDISFTTKIKDYNGKKYFFSSSIKPVWVTKYQFNLVGTDGEYYLTDYVLLYEIVCNYVDDVQCEERLLALL